MVILNFRIVKLLNCGNFSQIVSLSNALSYAQIIFLAGFASIVHTFYIENDAEIFPLHYKWKVAEKGFKMAFVMNKLAIINSCEIILKM
jgi:hypothetical protein